MKMKWYSLARLITPILFSLLMLFGILWKNLFLIAILMGSSLFLGAFHCGWLCPFGFIQDILGKLGKALKLPRLKIPAKIDRFLRFSRYILFGLSFLGLGFLYFIGTPYTTVQSFVYGNIAPIGWGVGLYLGAFLILALMTDRPFCRYFCTEGARYGLVSMGRLFSIRRNKESCIDCKLCSKACPMGIDVSQVNHVRNGQCINCFECVAACPKENTLQYGWAFKKSDKETKDEE
ncbi:MAG: 4Fe-4S binding protein [Spirochaetales bacterium]|nr:4Fe-4S binding protein [Spirochaetales bacterium]